jgi:hypothetical protein
MSKRPKKGQGSAAPAKAKKAKKAGTLPPPPRHPAKLTVLPMKDHPTGTADHLAQRILYRYMRHLGKNMADLANGTLQPYLTKVDNKSEAAKVATYLKDHNAFRLSFAESKEVYNMLVDEAKMTEMAKQLQIDIDAARDYADRMAEAHKKRHPLSDGYGRHSARIAKLIKTIATDEEEVKNIKAAAQEVHGRRGEMLYKAAKANGGQLPAIRVMGVHGTRGHCTEDIATKGFDIDFLNKEGALNSEGTAGHGDGEPKVYFTPAMPVKNIEYSYPYCHTYMGHNGEERRMLLVTEAIVFPDSTIIVASEDDTRQKIFGHGTVAKDTIIGLNHHPTHANRTGSMTPAEIKNCFTIACTDIRSVQITHLVEAIKMPKMPN